MATLIEKIRLLEQSIKRKATAAVLVGSLVVGGFVSYGCGKVEEEEKAPKSPSLECLTCETDATFNNNFAGIGGFALGITDKKWLADCQGFDFFEGHEGGYGDTLEIVGCENSMYLHWSYNMLGQITLYNKWNGKVQSSNIRIGDSLDVFLAAYPQAKQCPGMDRWYHELKGRFLEVDIDDNGKINRINIDFGSCGAYILVKSYEDADGDGFGNSALSTLDYEYFIPAGNVLKGGDCLDTNPMVYPGAPEKCDGIDNQCPGDTGHGSIDENCP